MGGVAQKDEVFGLLGHVPVASIIVAWTGSQIIAIELIPGFLG